MRGIIGFIYVNGFFLFIRRINIFDVDYAVCFSAVSQFHRVADGKLSRFF